MLKRKAFDRLKEWKKQPDKKALLITGARQIGKTFLVRRFGMEEYQNFVEINFITESRAADIFSENMNADTIIANLTAYTRKEMTPGKTLIFFDEIQECPRARTAIKFLVEDGRFDYIESGSLLGVNYKEVPSYPVGFEEQYQMYPLDLEEFLWANGVREETLAVLRECYVHCKPVSPSMHETVNSLFSYYVITGGMPAVVQCFVETHDMARVLRIQQDIVELYRQDISKYSQTDKIRIKDIFGRIPAELNDKNKRFMLSDIKKTARMSRYESSFMWLSDAGVSLPCYNVTEPKLPLVINEKRNLFKLFLGDVGLLCAMCMENVQFDILQGDLTVNMGSILENAAAQMLTAKGFRIFYFDKKNIGEIDFLVQRDKQVIPVEVKSGNDYKKHAALDNILKVEDWGLEEAFVFCRGNVERQEKITYLPWYMMMFLERSRYQGNQIVNVELSGLEA